MRYLTYFVGSFIAAAIFYYSIIFVLFPAPVAAEYWVREMLVIKRNIAKNLGSQPKIIIASGSSTLFNVDTNILSSALHRPTINLGLMGGLPIETIFSEVNAVSAPGDSVIMALEPDYYCRETNPGYDPWQTRNAIAWNYAFWQNKSFIEKLALVPSLGSEFPLEMIQARLDSIIKPESLASRLDALNDTKILAKYSNPPAASPESIYSIYNMDRLGNVKTVGESNYAGPPIRADEDIRICPQTMGKLTRFVEALKARKIKVVFANTPYIAFDGLDLQKVDESAKQFSAALAPLGPVIDSRSELVFPRDHFLDAVLHLNLKGRERRTQLLLKDIQSQQLLEQPY
jgi:hypothetical protein